MNLVVELKINNPSDWAIVERLLKRLKISFVQKIATTQPLTKEQTLLNELNTMLDAGVDASYYGNPIVFQRDARQDTLQPFRD